MRFPPPPPGAIHVWLADMDRPPLDADDLEALLSPAERARMARFVFARDRGRYAVARGLLRVVLGEATATPPERVHFRVGANGRLALDAGPAFNVSHSDARLAVALAGDDPRLPLGVDLELARPIPELEDVARRVCTPDELARLRARAGEARLAAFHRLWTRKEACMKATGAGFALAPDRFRVDLDAPAQRVALPPHDFAPAGLEVQVLDVPAGDGWAAAVAAAGAAAGDGWRLTTAELPAGAA